MICGNKMQDKICPTCNETYFRFIDYCFRDGTKLILPGEESEIEETEVLTQARRITPIESIIQKPSDEMTAPLGLNIAKPKNIKEGEVLDEDLEEPLALGNTQMLRKEDLMAMFQDDSTYNGELIESEEEDIEYSLDGETEDMEATETFDLTNRSNEEKTEFEQASAAPIIEEVSPVQAKAIPEAIPSPAVEPPLPPPKLKQPSESYEEKEPSGSPLFLMGGLLGLVVVVTGFVFFYQNQSNPVVNVPPVEKKVVAPVQKEIKKAPQKEIPVEVEEIAPEEEEIPEEKVIENSEEVPEPEEIEDSIPQLKLRVEVAGEFKIIEVTKAIGKEELIQKLTDIGVTFVEGESKTIKFITTDFKSHTVDFPLMDPYVEFTFGKEE